MRVRVVVLVEILILNAGQDRSGQVSWGCWPQTNALRLINVVCMEEGRVAADSQVTAFRGWLRLLTGQECKNLSIFTILFTSILFMPQPLQ